jgi:nucleotidyltransferase/DNA polymerase involved in DNA repair
MSDLRRLSDLSGIGKAMLKDFDRLGIQTVAQLATCDAQALYERIGAMDGQRHDPCVLDTYACAIAQARDPNLPAEQRQWWWWSRQRKAKAQR